MAVYDFCRSLERLRMLWNVATRCLVQTPRFQTGITLSPYQLTRKHFSQTTAAASVLQTQPQRKSSFDHSLSMRNQKSVAINNEIFQCDSHTNVTPRILEKIGVNLHRQKYHPLNLIKSRIVNHFYTTAVNRVGNPIYAVFDNISPVVTTKQNFDSLLIPEDHPSRKISDSYYIDCNHMLRGHTSAHQEELVRMGFDAFLVVGDVYRRDEVDTSHFPVFHQLEGVRLYNEKQVFERVKDPTDLCLFENGKRNVDKQEKHTMDAVKLLEYDLKQTLLGLTHSLFDQDVKYRWVECYFPFTHPSWELEILHEGEWLEVLGCGIMEQQLVDNAGAGSKAGWAFGLGLERLAMKLYQIPDIRLFWTKDSGFLNQFRVDDPQTKITYKPISQFPQCTNDLSFWIPDQGNFCSNDFYDLVRSVGEDIIEQVSLVDEFKHPGKDRLSHCYRIVYRHMEKTLTQAEVNQVHSLIAQKATELFGVEIR